MIDVVTPASNRPLAGRILDAGGVFVAEHPPGFPPRRQEYVRRNRIQSGMSAGSVVVESGEEGGAIHQGKFTTSQGRKLFCIVPDSSVPGRDAFRDGGANVLMRDAKAQPIQSSLELTKVIDSGMLQELFLKLEASSPFSGDLFP